MAQDDEYPDINPRGRIIRPPERHCVCCQRYQAGLLEILAYDPGQRADDLDFNVLQQIARRVLGEK